VSVTAGNEAAPMQCQCDGCRLARQAKTIADLREDAAANAVRISDLADERNRLVEAVRELSRRLHMVRMAAAGKPEYLDGIIIVDSVR
jgi:hypothetical protein